MEEASLILKEHELIENPDERKKATKIIRRVGICAEKYKQIFGQLEFLKWLNLGSKPGHHFYDESKRKMI